ncbi:MAG: peptide chain release factor N(5)-glutamine methyltransferase [Spirochaetaceae bacterium]|nr:MAG: peptide chain release factor N(5)-glutamine methyltransferase [Spirochaetaceae bacterium]
MFHQTTTIRTALQAATETLRQAGSDTAYLDALVLMGHVLGLSKEQLFARTEDPLSPADHSRFEALIQLRAQGEPVAYLRGVKEFYGRNFLVDPRVLIPRPDTETLVDTALALIDANPDIRTVFDCCTGSGCVAITLALERPMIAVAAGDVSRDALTVCRQNVARLAPDRVQLYQSNMMNAVPGRFDLIVANPPYVRTAEVDAMRAARWPEPTLALDGGTDGLDVPRHLMKSALEHLAPNRYLVIEGAYDQRAGMFEAFHQTGFIAEDVVSDLAGRDRVYVGKTRA